MTMPLHRAAIALLSACAVLLAGAWAGPGSPHVSYTDEMTTTGDWGADIVVPPPPVF